MIEDFWDKSLSIIVITFYAAGVISGLAILGWQVFYWLKNGAWLPLHFYDAFAYLGIDLKNVYIQNNWKGLGKIVQWLLNLPLSIIIPIICFSIAYFWKSLVTAANINTYNSH